MKLNVSLPILLLGMITSWITPQMGAIAASSNEVLPRSARIQSATGKVRIQRENYSNTMLARQGTELNRGDLIFPDQGVRVTVLCPTGSQRSVAAPSGLGTVCPIWRREAVRGDTTIDIAGDLNSSMAYFQTPRDRLMLSNTPPLSWNAIPGTTRYRVEVISPTGTHWITQASKPHIIYGGKPLEPGIAYTLKVVAESGEFPTKASGASAQSTTMFNFRVLRPAEVAAIKTAIAPLQTSKSSDAASALMLATYYQDYALPEQAIAAYGLTRTAAETYRLNAEAITILENQLQQGNPSALLYRTLGNLYWHTGLIARAEDAYLKALAQIQTPEDLEEWTLAYYGLAQVYTALNRSRQASQWLTQAKIGFIFLGNLAKAKELNPLIEELSKK
jgi:hypothetical protein